MRDASTLGPLGRSETEAASRQSQELTGFVVDPVWRTCAAGITLFLLVWPLVIALQRGPTVFDDAYMFHRYAMHVREGLGIAWNPDGVQTYGLTSHLWLFAYLPFTLLPLSASTSLQLASTLAGVLAIGLMALAVAGHAQQSLLRDWRTAASVVGLPLLSNPLVTFHLTTGMDTMLSMATHAGVVITVLGYLARPGLDRAIIVGAVAFLAVLTRPENGLAALGVPAMAFAWAKFTGSDKPRLLDLACLLALPVALIVVELAVCRLIFGVPLPLSFYAKSLHAYAGFQNPENAVLYLVLALASAAPFVAVILATMRLRDMAWLAIFLLPVLATFAYFLTVRQVMGWSARYYIPFLPYFAVPAILLLSRALNERELRARLPRRLAVSIAAVVAAFIVTWPIQRAVEAAYMRAILPPPIALPKLATAAGKPLPRRGWFDVIRQMSEVVVGPLPAGAVIAASEVGYLGASASGKTVIDLVGLNDTTIGRRGFSMDYLLARKPDLIWIPVHDYTGLVARILSDKRLFAEYVVIAGAFNYGIAIRRDSPLRAGIEANVAKAWAALYPGFRIEDYVVRIS
jgi:hypothetical protein